LREKLRILESRLEDIAGAVMVKLAGYRPGEYGLCWEKE
jgi:hypothetical protein